MSVELSPDLERRITDAVRAGQFETQEQLLEAAVCRLLGPPPCPSAGTRLSLDPPLIPPAGRRIDLSNERIYELIELA